MRRVSIHLFLVLAVLPAGARAPRRDIDVQIPPGTPLEWSAHLFRPMTTARHGVIPPKPGAPPKPVVKERASVVQQRVPEPILVPFGQTGLYDHFRVTTFDIMRHVVLQWPNRGKYDTGIPTGEVPDLIWQYPPTYPTEIYWSGALNALRGVLHPEVVSASELSAYLLEMGECALISSKSIISTANAMPVRGPLPLKNYPIDDMEVSDQRPPAAGGETPREQAIYRLVVVELTNGFPYAIDPRYARNSLALGRESLWAIIDCSRSLHPFLARNAVAVLGALDYPEALERLREIVGAGKDPIMWVRATMALIRKVDRTIIPDLERFAKSEDEILRTVAIYALGKMADPRVLPTLLKIAVDTVDPEVLWTVLPAIVRLADNTPEVRDTLRKVGAKRIKQERRPSGVGGFTPPEPEPTGTRDRVFAEMLLLGKAVIGDARVRSDFLVKMRRAGLLGFFPANRYLVIDVLRRMGKTGLPALLKILRDRRLETPLKLAALNAVRPCAPSMNDGLIKTVHDLRMPSVIRTTSLLALAEQEDPKPARDAALGMAMWYARKTGGVTPGDSAVIATAIQVLGSTQGGIPTDLAIRVTEKALKSYTWGFRYTKDSRRLTKAQIYSQPPLLEIAVVELGRTGDAKAVPMLARVLRSRVGGGRAEAALALGAYGGKEAIEALVNALGDAVSGWVRYNAYRSLKVLSGRDHYDDWMFTPTYQLRGSIRKYRDWWKSVKK